MDLADSGALDDSASTVDLNKDSSRESRSRLKLDVVDDFKINAELGRGGMGEVYLATERGLNRQVALKVLPAANRISSTQVKRFLLEAKAAAQLSHDHIVPIYHVGECEGIHYFTMRYIEGSDLAEIIRSGQQALRELSMGSVDTHVAADLKPKTKPGKSSESTLRDAADSTGGLIDLSSSSFVGSLRSSGSRSAHKLAVSVALIGQAVADALHHAHEHGIVHRDIKPSNLMLDHTNKVWVTDFGLAQLQDAPGLTNTGEMLGTLRYMSPEQASARPAFIDHRTDIYSLGVTLYELATLQKACRGECAQEILRSITFERPIPIRKINPKLPRDLETIICKATERNPSDRYQTAAELAADLRRFANSESLMARRPSRLKAARNWIWDRPAISAMWLAMLIVFAGSMMVVATTANNSRRIERQRADEFEQLLSFREGQQLINKSLLMNRDQPSLAIAAALEGAKAAPGPDADRALMAAIDVNHELKTIPLKFDFPAQCDISADGKFVVVSTDRFHRRDAAADALVIDLKAGRLVGTLANGSVVTGAKFFDRDRYLLSQSFRPQVQGEKRPAAALTLWDAVSYRPIKSYAVDNSTRISDASYSSVNQQLLIPDSESSVTILSVPAFEQVMVLPRKHKLPVIDCQFSQDGSKIATWSMDGTLIVWDASQGTEIRQIAHHYPDPSATSIFFTSDSQQVCISGPEGSRFLNCRDEATSEYRNPGAVVCTNAKHDLAYLLDGVKKSVSVLNVLTHETVAECKADSYISGVVPLSDDQHLAMIQDETIVVYNVRNGEKSAELKGHTDYVQRIVAVPNATEVVSIGQDRTLRHWDIRSDSQRRKFASRIQYPGVPLAVQSRDGNFALLGTIRVSEVAQKKLGAVGQTNLSLRGELICTLADGKVLTAEPESVSIWDLATQKRLQTALMPFGGTSSVRRALEVPESNGLALLTHDDELYFWDRKSSFARPCRLKEAERVTSMALDHTGSLLLSISTGELVFLRLGDWNRESVAKLPSAALGLELHPSENLVLVVCQCGTVLTFDLDKREQRTVLATPNSAISYAGFLGKDRAFTHGGLATKELTLWSLPDGKKIDSMAVKGIVNVATNSAGTAIAMAAKDGVDYWDVINNEKVEVSSEPSRCVSFVGDKLIVATGSSQLPKATEKLSEEPVCLLTWDCRSREQVSKERHQQYVHRILPLDESAGFLISNYSFGADCVNLKSGDSVRKLVGHLSPLLLVAFASHNEEVITVASDGNIILHALDGTRRTLGRHEYPILAATISDDRRLLMTADISVGMRYWDLQTGKLVREFSVGGEAISKLCISASNTTVAAQVGEKAIKHLDLRTGAETSLSIDEGIQKMVLSPDGQSLLVVTGSRTIYPAHPLETRASMTDSKPPQLLLINTVSAERKVVELTGFASDCEFVDNGKQLAVLSTLGLIQIFDCSTLKPSVTIEAPRRTMQLLEGPLGVPTVYAASKNQASGWSIKDGKQTNHFSLSLSGYQASLHPEPILPFVESTYYLFQSGDQFVRQPVNVEGYARQIAPRRLNVEERSKLLDNP